MYPLPPHQVNCIAFHPAHGTLATVGSDGRFSFWDKDARTKLKTSEPLDQPISSCAFNYNGNIFAYSVSYDWSKVCVLYSILITADYTAPSSLLPPSPLPPSPLPPPSLLPPPSGPRALLSSEEEQHLPALRPGRDEATIQEAITTVTMETACMLFLSATVVSSSHCASNCLLSCHVIHIMVLVAIIALTIYNYTIE